MFSERCEEWATSSANRPEWGRAGGPDRRAGKRRTHPGPAADRLVAAAQRRLAATTLVLLVALLAAVGVTTAILAERQLDASVDSALQTAAQTELVRLRDASGSEVDAEPSDRSGHGDGSDDDGGHDATPAPTRPIPTAAPTSDLDDRVPAAADTFFLYLDAAGVVVSNPERVALTGLPDAAATAVAARTGRDLRTVQAGGVRVRLLTLAVSAEEGTAAGIRTIQAGFVLTLRDEQNDSLRAAILVVGIGGLLGAAVVSVLLTRRALRPVRAAFDRERRFVAAASHELRTPIAVIRSSAEVLSREANVRPEGERLVSDIIAEADRLGGLVAELSDLALAQAKPSDEMTAVDLAAVATDVVHRATPLAEDSGVRLEAADGAPVIVRGDRDRIVQVVLILIDNAIRHSPPGGTVRVSVVTTRGRGEVAVADDGPGIPPEHREQIFEPFARLIGTGAGRAGSHRGSAASPGSSGSGLGLAIARAIVTGMSGEIRVSDNARSGAVFTMSLPLA